MPDIQLTPEKIAALQDSQRNLQELKRHIDNFGKAGFDNSQLVKAHQSAVKGASGLLQYFGGASTKSK